MRIVAVSFTMILSASVYCGDCLLTKILLVRGSSTEVERVGTGLMDEGERTRLERIREGKRGGEDPIRED